MEYEYGLFFLERIILGLVLAKAPIGLFIYRINFGAFTTHVNMGYAYDLFFLERIILGLVPAKAPNGLFIYRINFGAFTTHVNMGSAYDLFFLERIICSSISHISSGTSSSKFICPAPFNHSPPSMTITSPLT